MRKSTLTLAVAVPAAFAAGILLSPLAHEAISDAHAQTSAMTPHSLPAMLRLGN